MSRYDFLVETYRTERLKTLGVWAQIPEDRWRSRTEPRARTPHEHLVHQCASEDAWMRTMLAIDVGQPVFPPEETRDAFIRHYSVVSEARLAGLRERPETWFEEETRFFDVVRSKAWVLTRRMTHTAHHRGQLTACLRSWGQPLYSTYGPTADTGGLPKDRAQVIYPSALVDRVLSDASSIAEPLESVRGPVTERP